MSIENDFVELNLEHHYDKDAAVKIHYRDLEEKNEHQFTLDFSWYESSFIGVRAGVYTMHTDVADSKKYMHHLTGIKAFKGELVQQYVIYYRHSLEHMIDIALPKDDMDYYAKVILHADEL